VTLSSVPGVPRELANDGDGAGDCGGNWQHVEPVLDYVPVPPNG
jgi:hypothetical protein